MKANYQILLDYSSWETSNYTPCLQYSLLRLCVLCGQSLSTFPPLTHWFLDDPVVVRGVICIHWLQEWPRHFMCLQMREGPKRERDKEKDKTVEKAETNEEKQTAP